MNGNDECSFNIIVDKVEKCYRNMCVNSSIEELEKKGSIVLFRSAKEEVLCRFLMHMDKVGYRGKIYVIGRESDRQYLSELEKLHVSLFAVNNEQKYTIDNTYEYIESINTDAICFLYQNILSKGYENLYSIINQTSYEGYAISNQLEAVKLVKVNEYLEGVKIYNALCDWFYKN